MTVLEPELKVAWPSGFNVRQNWPNSINDLILSDAKSSTKISLIRKGDTKKVNEILMLEN